MKSDIEEKIGKLLSLTGSDNPNEAQAALLKAQELMLKYNISLGYEGTAEEICTKVIRCKGRLGFFEGRMANLVADNFRTKVWGMYGKYNFMGYRADVMASVHCFEFLLKDSKEKFEKYYKDNIEPEAGKNILRAKSEARKQWQEGYVKGLSDAFDSRKSDPKYELMTVTPYAVLCEYEKLNLQHFEISAREIFDEKAYSAGYADGKSAMDQRSIP